MLFYIIIILILPLVSLVVGKSLHPTTTSQPTEDIFNDIPVGVYESLPLPTDLRPLEPVRLEMRSTEYGHLVGLSVAETNVGCPTRVRQYDPGSLSELYSSHDISNCYWFSHYVVKQAASIIKRRLDGTRDFDPDQVVLCTTRNSTKDDPHLTLFLHATRKHHGLVELNWPVHLRLKSDQQDHEHSMTSAKSPTKTASLPVTMADANPPGRRRKRKIEKVDGEPRVKRQVEVEPVAEKKATVDAEESPVSCDFTGPVRGAADVEKMETVDDGESSLACDSAGQVEVVPVAQNKGAAIEEVPRESLGADRRVEVAPEDIFNDIPVGVYESLPLATDLRPLEPVRLEMRSTEYGHLVGLSVAKLKVGCLFRVTQYSRRYLAGMISSYDISKCYWFSYHIVQEVTSIIKRGLGETKDFNPGQMALCTTRNSTKDDPKLTLFLHATRKSKRLTNLRWPVHLRLKSDQHYHEHSTTSAKSPVNTAPLPVMRTDAKERNAMDVDGEPIVSPGVNEQITVAPAAQKMETVDGEKSPVSGDSAGQVEVAPVAQNMATVIKEEPTVYPGMKVEVTPVAQNIAAVVAGAGCEEPPIPAGVYTPTTFPSGLGNLMFAKLEISYTLTMSFADIFLFEPDKMHYEKCPFYEVPPEQLNDNLLHHHSIA
ncbi:hypothetical protein FOZ62_027204, partial [Perkinsus olseni]